MEVHPLLVKRFTERKLLKLMLRRGQINARYCPVDTVSCLPENCIAYGKGVVITKVHEGEPLMLAIQAQWDSDSYDVPLTDLAVARNTNYN